MIPQSESGERCGLHTKEDSEHKEDCQAQAQPRAEHRWEDRAPPPCAKQRDKGPTCSIRAYSEDLDFLRRI